MVNSLEGLDKEFRSWEGWPRLRQQVWMSFRMDSGLGIDNNAIGLWNGKWKIDGCWSQWFEYMNGLRDGMSFDFFLRVIFSLF